MEFLSSFDANLFTNGLGYGTLLGVKTKIFAEFTSAEMPVYWSNNKTEYGQISY